MAKETLNSSLHRAKHAKEDEFYTQLKDIENELVHYREHFKDKVIFLNCDDPRESNFWKYFYLNFEFLGIKKVISTHFDYEEPTYKLEYGIDKNGQLEIKQTELKGNGDFRSKEAIDLLKEADIVVTNPPFSLFREYISQLIEYDKQFLVIGSQNNITYKDIFSLFKENKIWLGYHSGDMAFRVPNDEKYKRDTRFWIDENGDFWRSLGNICWYTNLDIPKRNEDLILWEKYTPEAFPKYDNYNAINVDRVKNIPKDYPEAMGVPITFLSNYNPNQFVILGQTHSGDDSKETEALRTSKSDRHRGFINGSQKYARILIQRTKESLKKQKEVEKNYNGGTKR